MKVVDILLDFVKSTNDRNAKILDFHHPADMMRLLDLEIPDTGLTLQQLLLDCSMTLKYQVKTGEYKLFPFLCHTRTVQFLTRRLFQVLLNSIVPVIKSTNMRKLTRTRCNQ